MSTGLVKITKISHAITLVTYKTQSDLCKAFCRIEEYYEGVEFKNKIFTLGQFRNWYSKEFGSWSYEKDWDGFNVTAHAFNPFFNGTFDPLNEPEQELVDLFRSKPFPYCVIGISEQSDADVLEHELCHAMFATDHNYKTQVLEALKVWSADLENLKSYLRSLGYHEDVILDECHAYVCESSKDLEEKKIPYPIDLKQTLKELKEFYRGDIK